MSDGCQLTDRY